jgi:autotransporter-associated beta strand protein
MQRKHPARLRRNSCHRNKLLLGAVLAGATVNNYCRAATILDNVPDSSYTALSAQSQYASSGFVEVNGGQVFGSGTLIAPNWVLTAAHVVTQNATGFPAYSPSQVTFGMGSSVGSSTIDPVSRIIVESGWSYNLGAGDDLALIELATPITTVAPAVLYNSSLGSELGQVATVIGYGKSGTGLTGATSGAGTRRGITNTIDSFGGQLAGGVAALGMSSNLMFTDFDQPNNPLASIMGAATPTAMEGASAPGDSGGGLFLTVNNETYLAGVTDFLGSLPTNVLSPNPDGHYGDYNGYTRVSVPQSLAFIDSVLVPTSWWGATGGGSWTSSTDWANGLIPNAPGAGACFGGAITAPATITLDGSWTVGNLVFNSTNTYTLATGSGGSLTLDNGGASATAAITDNGGTHCINVPVTLNSNVQMNVANAGDSLNIWGAISGAGSLTVSGSGAVSLSGVNTYQGLTTVNSGTLNIQAAGALPFGGNVVNNGSFAIKANSTSGSISGSGALTIGTTSTPAILKLANGSGLSSQNSLVVNPNSTLDIGNNSVAINYTGTSPEPAIAALLALGYSSGSWTGTGITSSVAAANPAHLSVGYVDGSLDAGVSAQPNQVLFALTIPGDAALNGTVNFNDLLVVCQHLQTDGNDWSQGNFDYDPNGFVGFSDLLIVAENLNTTINIIDTQLGQSSSNSSAGQSQTQFDIASVPEPCCATAAALGALLLSRRRKNKPVFSQISA